MLRERWKERGVDGLLHMLLRIVFADHYENVPPTREIITHTPNYVALTVVHTLGWSRSIFLTKPIGRTIALISPSVNSPNSFPSMKFSNVFMLQRRQCTRYSAWMHILLPLGALNICIHCMSTSTWFLYGRVAVLTELCICISNISIHKQPPY